MTMRHGRNQRHEPAHGHHGAAALREAEMETWTRPARAGFDHWRVHAALPKPRRLSMQAAGLQSLAVPARRLPRAMIVMITATPSISAFSPSGTSVHGCAAGNQ